MSLSAEQFFKRTAQPAYKDCLAMPLSLRHAMFAAIAMHHMADYRALESYAGPDTRKEVMDVVAQVRDGLVAKCPDVALLGDIADAAKHSRLTTPKAGARLVQDASRLDATPGIFGAPYGQGVFNEAAYIYVELPDGTRRPFLGVLRSVYELWLDELGE